MKRIRTGVWAAAGGCVFAAAVSGKVYGTSLSSDAGTTASSPAATGTAPMSPAAPTASTATADETASPTQPAATTTRGTACPAGLPGPDLVFIPAPVPFCIDGREVTQGQYGEFLNAAAAAAPQQPDECSWNDRFEPIPYDPTTDVPQPAGYCPAGLFDPAAHPDQAARCVDWCDARAYCAWAGKRLCGAIGGHMTLDAVATTERNPQMMEWQYVCTGAGKYVFPYGDTYAPGRCIDETSGRSAHIAVFGSRECTGVEPPYSDVSDMVGNVFEWNADCDKSGGSCAIMGGYGLGTGESCAGSSGRTSKVKTAWDIGFRCCADAVMP